MFIYMFMSLRLLGVHTVIFFSMFDVKIALAF